MENEIFKDIENYEGLYLVSNLGNVKSLGNDKARKERILKPGVDSHGYPIVRLSKERKCKTITVHRLVASAFIPNPEGKREVNHINGIKLDNKVSNLEWNTRSENMRHADKTGLRDIKGSKHSLSKLTEKDIIVIRQMLNEGITQKDIAIKFDVSQAKISHIKTGLNWNHC